MEYHRGISTFLTFGQTKEERAPARQTEKREETQMRIVIWIPLLNRNFSRKKSQRTFGAEADYWKGKLTT